MTNGGQDVKGHIIRESVGKGREGPHENLRNSARRILVEDVIVVIV